MLTPGRHHPARRVGAVCAVLLALGLSSAAAAQTRQLGVTTTTTYEYDAETLLPTAVTVSSSDGAYRRTETEYAHEVWEPMETLNMLSQVYRTVVRDTLDGGARPERACSQVDWRLWTVSGATFWAPNAVFEGCGPSDSGGGERALTLRVDAYTGRGRPAQTTNKGGVETTYTYNGQGRLTGMTQRDGGLDVPLPTGYAYDNRGRLESVTDPNGNATGYRYDGLGRLSEVLNPDGQTRERYEYVYSAGATGSYDRARPNRVTTVVPASSNQGSTAWFDGLGRPVGQTAYHHNAGNRSSTKDDLSITEYDAAGRPFRQWRPIRVGGRDPAYPIAPPCSEVPPDEQCAHWDGGIYIRPQIFPDRSEVYWGGELGVGPLDYDKAYTETVYEADPLARPARVLAPGGDATAFDYGVARPDASFPGRRPEGPAPQMAYTETTDPDGLTARTYTDALGRQRFAEAGRGTPDHTLTETVYDAADRVVETRPPTCFMPRAGDPTPCSEHASTYRYTTRGDLTRTTTPDAGATNMVTDTDGRRMIRQDAEQRTRITKGSFGEAQYVTFDGLGRPLYDVTWQLACAVGDVDPRTFQCPDGQDPRKTGTNTPLRRLQYDVATGSSGNPFNVDPSFVSANTRGAVALEATWSDGKVQSVAYAYDDEGRVAERAVRTGGAPLFTERFRYEYDRAGLLVDRQVGVFADQDPVGDLFRQQYEYSSDEQLYRVWTGTGTGTWGTLVAAPAEMWSTYDAAGSLSFTRFLDLRPDQPGMDREYRGYDVAGRVRYVQDPGFGESPFREELRYTDAGRVSDVVTRWPATGPYAGADAPAGTPAAWREWSYALNYDGVGRLRQASYGNGSGQTDNTFDIYQLDYDGNGNVTRLFRNGLRPTGSVGRADELTYAYRAGTNRLTGVEDASDAAAWYGATWDADDTALFYDARGGVAVVNTTSHPGGRFGRLQRVRDDPRGLPTYETVRTVDETDPDGPYTTYDVYSRYDGSGLRIRRDVTSDAPLSEIIEDHYVRDGGQVVAVFDANAGALRYWNTGAGRELADGSRVVYRRDHLGTPRAVQQVGGPLGERGRIVEARDYYPFGLQMPGRVYVSGTPTREDYTGHELDAETGLHYMGARYYMAALGRFTSVDPLAGDFPGYSPYNYALNNPLSLIDPDGMAPSCPDPPCDEGVGGFVRGVGRGIRDGAASTLSGVKQLATDPIGAGRALGSAVVNYEETAAAIGDAVGERVDAVRNGSAGDRGEVLGEVLVIAAEVAVGTKGVQALTRTARGARTGGTAATATTQAAGRIVTADVIASALEGATLSTSQRAISIPMVQRYVRMIENGSSAPAIRVDAARGMIVDGNHRYVAGLITGRAPAVQAATARRSAQAVPWSRVRLDPVDWNR